MDHLLRVALPVPLGVGGVGRLVHGLEREEVLLLELPERTGAAALHGAHPRRVAEGDEEVLTDLRPEELQVLRALHLVPDDAQPHVEVARVVAVLAVDGHALAGRFGDEEGHVEAGEHAGGEGVAAGRHVDDDIGVPPVHQVVQAELHRAGLGVVAGDPEVALGEGAGGEQPHPALRLAVGGGDQVHVTGARVEDGVGALQPQQPRAATGRCRLDHGGGGGDARVGAPQVVLDQRQVRSQRWQRGRCLLVEAECGTQVLVDVRVHGGDRHALRGEGADEERGERGLATAALADESDLHVQPT